MFNSNKTPPKKPGLLIAMMGKKSPAQDPEAPDSIEKPSAPPFGRPPLGKTSPRTAPPVTDDETGEVREAHEAAEAPGYENSEESGAAIVQDIEAAGAKHGMDAQQSHAFAADLFSSLAECLRRGGQSDETDQAGSGDYPA